MSKSDLKSFDDLSEENKQLLNELSKDQSVKLISMSNKTGEGIETVKVEACETLLKHRDG
jgi:selenocysteine-specific translation elongation factor